MDLTKALQTDGPMDQWTESHKFAVFDPCLPKSPELTEHLKI